MLILNFSFFVALAFTQHNFVYQVPNIEWESCGGENDLLKVLELVVQPENPTRGSVIQISGRGILTDPIIQGGEIAVVVKYGKLPVVKKRLGFCEQIQEVGLSCPLDPSEISVAHEVELPKNMLTGKYEITAEAIDEQKKRIFCVRIRLNVLK